MNDCFAALGIEATSSLPAIRKAYRSLAKKWHPDRFPAGPERAWAEEKMIELNNAYAQCLSETRNPSFRSVDSTQNDERFALARSLIDQGEHALARASLLEMKERCAEWNYLFGVLLLRRMEYEKACTYFRIASHQRPEIERYTVALRNAQLLNQQSKRNFLRRLLPGKKQED